MNRTWVISSLKILLRLLIEKGFCPLSHGSTLEELANFTWYLNHLRRHLIHLRLRLFTKLRCKTIGLYSTPLNAHIWYPLLIKWIPSFRKWFSTILYYVISKNGPALRNCSKSWRIFFLLLIIIRRIRVFISDGVYTIVFRHDQILRKL